jgi:hypothetical protein
LDRLAPVGADHPGYYISNTGRVFSTRGKAPREMSPWPNGQGGYHRLTLRSSSGKPRTLLVHRLVALAFLPPAPPRKPLVRHLDGNPSNNNVGNLAWGDHADNYADSVRHGTAKAPCGEEHGLSKLTRADVKKLRELMRRPHEDWTYASLARELGVSPITVSRAMKSETWCHLPSAADVCKTGGE